MLVLFVSIPLLPLAGVSHQILRSILCSISDAQGASFVCFNTFTALAGVSNQKLRSILCSILDARGASFVCFNTFAASSWG